MAGNSAKMLRERSASYAQIFVDMMDDMPDDIQRGISHFREVDSQYHRYVNEASKCCSRLGETEGKEKKKLFDVMQNVLIRVQQLGDEKIELMQQLCEALDGKMQLLDDEWKEVCRCSQQENMEPPLQPIPKADSPERPIKRAKNVKMEAVSAVGTSGFLNIQKEPKKEERPTRASFSQKSEKSSTAVESTSFGATSESKKSAKKGNQKAVKTEKTTDETLDEPTYCICERISFGEMIACDNEQCAIEWFHFDCVGLKKKPRGNWYCFSCRGDRANVPNPCL